MAQIQNVMGDKFSTGQNFEKIGRGVERGRKSALPEDEAAPSLWLAVICFAIAAVCVLVLHLLS